MQRRTFNTPVREPWNPIIHHLLKAIDCHMGLYMRHGDRYHAEQAQLLRNYVMGLKNWIHAEEERVMQGLSSPDPYVLTIDQGRLEP